MKKKKKATHYTARYTHCHCTHTHTHTRIHTKTQYCTRIKIQMRAHTSDSQVKFECTEIITHTQTNTQTRLTIVSLLADSVQTMLPMILSSDLGKTQFMKNIKYLNVDWFSTNFFVKKFLQLLHNCRTQLHNKLYTNKVSVKKYTK